MNLRDELLAIRAARSALTPDIVVEEATAPDHPLHSHFEWDDTVAGQFWRRHQAGQLIRSVTITYTRQNGTQGKLREFHAVTRHKQPQVQHEPFEELLQSAARAGTGPPEDAPGLGRLFRARYEKASRSSASSSSTTSTVKKRPASKCTHGAAWRGEAGPRSGQAWPGVAGPGVARAWLGGGSAWRGRARRLGTQARPGMARQARRGSAMPGVAGHGSARHGSAGAAGLGSAGRGWAWRGKAGLGRRG